jgi:hypothetical protein
MRISLEPIKFPSGGCALCRAAAWAFDNARGQG